MMAAEPDAEVAVAAAVVEVAVAVAVAVEEGGSEVKVQGFVIPRGPKGASKSTLEDSSVNSPPPSLPLTPPNSSPPAQGEQGVQLHDGH